MSETTQSTPTASDNHSQNPAPAKLKITALTALVVGSMIGGGIFSLPQNMAAGAGAGAIVIAWAITAAGMLALACVFQILATRRPHITGGVYGYARAGFGNLMGFSSAWGYWLAAFLGNVGYLIVLFSALSYFLPTLGFGHGNTIPAIAGASVVLWLLHYLVLRGVQTAAFINTLATFAKLVPLGLFVVLVVVGFKAETFRTDFWGSPALGPVIDQIKSTMLVTVWVFVGIEGASVYSTRAEKMSDVGRATLTGFLLTLVLLMAVSLLSLGVLPQHELAALKNPSMAGVLELVVGPWGAAAINLGLIVSVMGALLSWTMLAAELPFIAARDGIFPRRFARTNRNDAPVAALWLTNGAIQVFLLISYAVSNAYLSMIKLATSTALVPYLLCALYAWIVTRRRLGYADGQSSGRDLVLAGLAVLYSIWLLYAAGLVYLLLTALLYAPGLLVFVKARRESGKPMFKGAEWAIAAGSVAAFVASIVLLLNGTIDLSRL